MPMETTEDYDHGNSEENGIIVCSRGGPESEKEKGCRVEKKFPFCGGVARSDGVVR